MRRTVKILGILACLMLLPAVVFAQGGASIAGVAKDTSGAVLPGVTIEVASPALIERIKSAVTDGGGQFRIVDLRPGTYTVTATLSGFSTFKRDGLEVSGTGVITVNPEMRVGSIAETITVSGESPLVDLQSTTKQRVMGKDVIDALPSGRMFYSVGVLLPGLTITRPDVGGSRGDESSALGVHGLVDQALLYNGLKGCSILCSPNLSAMQEIAVDIGGNSAEKANGGVIVNFIAKEGGNTFRGSFFGTGATEAMQSSNFTQELKDQGLPSADHYKENWDFSPSVGGPILKNKLWFQTTYRNFGTRVYQAGMFFNQNEYRPNVWTRVPDPSRRALFLHGDWWSANARMTWQANAKNKISAQWEQQRLCRCPDSNTVLASPESARDRPAYPQQLIQVEWTSPVTSKILLEFGVLKTYQQMGFYDMAPGEYSGTAEQLALIPSLIGVTQTSGDAIPNVTFHGPAANRFNGKTSGVNYRWAVSYVTGAHALKIGGDDAWGSTETTNYANTFDAFGRPVRYRFNTTNSPDQVTVSQTPNTVTNNSDHDLGLFVQDRWTRKRLTLNGGLRLNWLATSVPAQLLEATTMGRPEFLFPEIGRTASLWDWVPRMGASYDLNGNGKTAIKVGLNKFTSVGNPGVSPGGAPGNANPISKLTASSSRTWNDQFFGPGDPRSGNFIVDCDLKNPAVNGECRNAGSAAFGSLVVPGATPDNPAAISDWNVREGWNKRPFNWEFSAGVQHEILPRTAIDVTYYRRWFGNFRATDNRSVGPSDFRYFSVVTPIDARLPGGGGQTIGGFVDFASVAASTVAANNQTVFVKDLGINQVQNWNGVDISVNTKPMAGFLIQGGTSTGRRYSNTCEVVAALPETIGADSTSYCDQTEPFMTQLKLVTSYTLPASLGRALGNIQLAATVQSVPGRDKSNAFDTNSPVQYSYSSSATDPRGNELANPAISTLAGGLINGNAKNLNIVPPNTAFEQRLNMLDLRFGKILKFGRTRAALNADFYNVLNNNSVLLRNQQLTRNLAGTAAAPIDITNATNPDGSSIINGAANQVRQGQIVNGINTSNTLWTPTAILQARYLKFSVQFDF